MATHLCTRWPVGFAVHEDASCGGLSLSGQHLYELELAVAGNACDADYFTGANLERHGIDGSMASIVFRAQTFDAQMFAAADMWGTLRLVGNLTGAAHQ